MYKLYISFRFSLPKTSAKLSARHSQLLHSRIVLTHRDTEGDQDKRDYAEDSEDLATASLTSPGIDECRERVEEEILEHHLQHEYFCRLPWKRVAEDTTVVRTSPSGSTQPLTYRMYNPAEVDGTEIPKHAQP